MEGQKKRRRGKRQLLEASRKLVLTVGKVTRKKGEIENQFSFFQMRMYFLFDKSTILISFIPLEQNIQSLYTPDVGSQSLFRTHFFSVVEYSNEQHLGSSLHLLEHPDTVSSMEILISILQHLTLGYPLPLVMPVGLK